MRDRGEDALRVMQRLSSINLIVPGHARLFSALIERTPSPAVFHIREYWMDIGRMNGLQGAHNKFEVVFGS